MKYRSDTPTCWCTTTTPIGELLLTACANGLTGVYFEGRWPSAELDSHAASESELPVLQQAQSELAAYFAGTLREFSTPLWLNGTVFQQRVWEALRVIPFGEVVSYKTVAARLGDPKAVRAVGAANGRNPILPEKHAKPPGFVRRAAVTKRASAKGP